MAVALGFAAAGAQGRRAPLVSIKGDGVSPAVVVVPPGTQVIWRNADARPHGLKGKVTTLADLAPGATFMKRFTRPGSYDYWLRDNDAVTGLVVVTGGGAGGHVRRPAGGGVVTHRFKGTLSLAVKESYTFYDNRYGSTAGPCNNEVGSGTRTIAYTINLRGLRYTRAGRSEVLASSVSPGRLRSAQESLQAQVPAIGQKQVLQCVDAQGQSADDPPRNEKISCNQSFAGGRLKLSFGWVPSHNYFTWTNDGPRLAKRSCGPQYPGGLAVAGVDITKPLLPVNLVSDKAIYDVGRTSAATAAEVRAIRAGRRLTIRRRLSLHFTATCCTEWVPPGKEGDYEVYTRNGAIFRVSAVLTVRLRPA